MICTVGTRSSQLALAQTRDVIRQLQKSCPQIDFQIKEILTIGDQRLDVSLSKIGGKGLFTQELETGILNRDIRFAVHSLKDLPIQLPEKLVIGSTPKREKANDVIVWKTAFEYDSSKPLLKQLPAGYKVGTSSLRRKSQLLINNPYVSVTLMRGNVPTRIRKMMDGCCDAIILAKAGLNRLEIVSNQVLDIDCEEMLPAVGQGALAIECRQDDFEIRNILQSIHDTKTNIEVSCERAFLKRLGGSCNLPVACLAHVIDNRLEVQGLVASTDGKKYVREILHGHIDNHTELGIELAEIIIKNGGDKILKDCESYE